jgi:hypothetical protein
MVAAAATMAKRRQKGGAHRSELGRARSAHKEEDIDFFAGSEAESSARVRLPRSVVGVSDAVCRSTYISVPYFITVIAGSDDVPYVVIVLIVEYFFRFRNLISPELVLLPFLPFSRRKLCIGSSRQYKSFFFCFFLKQTIQEFVNKTVYTNR